MYAPAEDSELLAQHLKVGRDDDVLEIGVGSGYVSLVAASKARSVVGVDVNLRAVALAGSNASLNGITNVQFLHADMFGPLRGKFDLILSIRPTFPTAGSTASWTGHGAEAQMGEL